MVVSTSLSVGDVARRSGVAVSTLHFYERKGMISGWRTEGNQRRYPRSVLRRVAVIRIGLQAGIGLGVIKTFLDQIPEESPLSREDWQRFTTSWRAMLGERIRRLQQLRDQLDSCIGCGCLSLSDCPLRNADDRLAQHGPGPRLLEDA